jgi:hypothetical protein
MANPLGALLKLSVAKKSEIENENIFFVIERQVPTFVDVVT